MTISTAADKADLRSDNNENEEKNVETISPPPVTEVPPKWKKYLKMQKARVPNEAILQLAKVQGKTPTKEDVAELRKHLGMEVVEDEETDGQGPSDPSMHDRYADDSPPPYFQKFLRMKKRGIPKDAILHAAKIQGHDLSKLEPWLDKVDERAQSSAESKADDDNSYSGRSKYASYVKMREKGISIAFVLETAKNQLVASSEIAELEKILANVAPSKSTGY